MPRPTATATERIDGTWLDSAGYRPTPAPTRSARWAAIDESDVRTPHRNNWDFVATKDIRFGGSVRGQIRLEVLNITDTVKVRGPIETLGSGNVRPDPRAVGLHAPDAADVPAVVLSGTAARG